MIKQKFRRGNLVHIKDGSCQPHFKQGLNAVILGSYGDIYGGCDIFNYLILFEDGKECSWYEDQQLSLIEEGGEHLIEQIIEDQIRSDAEYILTHKSLTRLGSSEIVILLRLIGFDYSISNNYFELWKILLPVYQEIKESNSLIDLKDKYPEYDIKEVWDIYHKKTGKSVYMTAINSMLEEYPHIKLDDAEINPVSGQIKVCFVHTPRGVHIREPIQEDTFQQVKEIINSANGAIKKMAVEDVINWCIEEREPVNLNGISVILDSTIPRDTMIMNPAKCLELRRANLTIIKSDTK